MIIKCKDISVSDGISYHSLIDNKVADGNSYVPMQMEKFGVCHGNDYYVPYASIMDNPGTVRIWAANGEIGFEVRFQYPVASRIVMQLHDMTNDEEYLYSLVAEAGQQNISTLSNHSSGRDGHTIRASIVGIGDPEIVGVFTDHIYRYYLINPEQVLTVDLIPVMIYREILYDDGVLLFRSTASVLTPFTIGLHSTDKPGTLIAEETMPDPEESDPSRSMRINLSLIPRNTQYYIRFNGQDSNYSDGVNRYYMNVESVTVLESPETLLTNTGKVSFSRSEDLLTYNIRFDRMIETLVNIAIIDITSSGYNWVGQAVMTSPSDTFEDSIRLSDDMNGHTIKVMQYTQDAGVKTPVDSYSYESYTYVFEGNEYIVT